MAVVSSKIAKIILMGDGYVGKTTLRKRYMGDNFRQEYMVTIGADFAVKSIKTADSQITLQIWDLAGQEQFAMIRDRYYKGSSGGLLVFDLTKRSSYENIPNWINEFVSNNENTLCPMILLGNKSDLLDEVERTVSQAEIDQYVNELKTWGVTLNPDFDIEYLETSAKFGTNVDQAFESILDKVKFG